jgi:3-oxoacyl-[acyl-carrier protein] reductase
VYFALLAEKRCIAAADYIFASEREAHMQRLTDQVAIVTGGAKGVGRGIGSVLGLEGAGVVIADLDGGLGEATAVAFRTQGLDALAVTTDVTDRASVDAMTALVLAERGRIDILAANAGVYPTASVAALDDTLWDRVMDINVRGAVHAVQACMPAMVSRRYGRIVLTSSITGPVTGQPGFSHYGASKAAMLGFMRSAAVELATTGVTVNAVLPGNVQTPGFEDTSEEHQRQMLRAIPLGRFADPEDVGWAVRFLASAEAGYITGQTLIVDGGQTLPEGSSGASLDGGGEAGTSGE